MFFVEQGCRDGVASFLLNHPSMVFQPGAVDVRRILVGEAEWQLRYLCDGSAKGAKSLQALVMKRLSSSCVKLNIVHAETKDIR